MNHRHSLPDRNFRTAEHRGMGRIRSRDISLRIPDFRYQADFPVALFLIDQSGFHGDHRGIFIDFRRCYAQAIRLDVETLPSQQIHIAVKAASRIPSAVQLHSVIDDNLQFIFLPVFEKMIQAYVEIGVSVRISPRIVPVHVHPGIHIGAFQLQDNRFLFPLLRDEKFLSIVVQASRIKSRLAAVSGIRRPFLLHHGVMGKRYLFFLLFAVKESLNQGTPGVAAHRPVLIKLFSQHTLPPSAFRRRSRQKKPDSALYKRSI